MKIKIDSDGMAELLKSAAIMTAVENAARVVADNAEKDPSVQRHGVPVGVRTGYTDRARAVVALAHPAGIGIQAKHGTLTRAVSAAGLKDGVRSSA